MIDLQKNLGAVLNERGILHKNVAQAMGVTDAAVSNWFNRTVELKFSTISQICEKFNIPVVDVVTYPEKYIPQDSVNPDCEECRKKEVKKRTVISQDRRTEIQQYLEQHDPAFLIFVQLVFFSLMRPMEIRRCRIHQLHLDEHYILIPADQAKCWKERPAPLSDELVGRIRKYLYTHPHKQDDYLFSSWFRPGATMTSHKAVWKRWEKVVKALDLKDGQTVYSLRDSGITDMLHNGMDELTVMQAAGHHDLSITSGYADHVDEELVERVREGQVSFG